MKDSMKRPDLKRLSGSKVGPADYGVYMWDVAADAFRMDATLCQYLGVAQSIGAEGVSLHHVVDLLHKADRAGFVDGIETSAQTGSPFKRAFRLKAASEDFEELQAVGHSFLGAGRVPDVCTGLVFRVRGERKEPNSELADHCIAAFEVAKQSGSEITQYLISMVLIELGYQIAGFEPRTVQ